MEKIRTLGKASEGVYKEKGSKFMAFAYPVHSEKKVKEKIESLKKQYHDARHHCYAYILAGPPEYFRAYDDREPKHSAGDPILGQLRSHQLHDVLVVVIRYFGGTKLGVSGLINAYKTAAAEAILNNSIVEYKVTKSIRIQFDYEATNEVMQMLQVHNLEIIHQDFKENCTFTVGVNLDKYEAVYHQFDILSGIKIL